MPSSHRLTKLAFWPTTGFLLLLVLGPFLVQPTAIHATSHWTPHAAITIVGDSAFTPSNGVTGGNGTAASPYVIEGWLIEPPTGVGISVRNTTAHFVIRDIVVHGNGNAQGMEFTLVSNATLQNSTVTGSMHGLRIMHSKDIHLEDAVFEDNAGSGLLVEFAQDVSLTRVSLLSNAEEGARFLFSTRVVLVDLVARFNKDPGVGFLQVFGAVVENGTFEFNPRGIEVVDSANASISNSEIIRNPYAGVAINSSQNMTVWGNDISKNSGNGLEMDGSYEVAVRANVFTYNSVHGVHLEDANEIQVENNTLTKNGRVGLRIRTSTNVTLHQNNFQGEGVFMTGVVPEEYTTHTLGDNLVNGKPLVFHKNCVDLNIADLDLGQLLVVNCTGVRLHNITSSLTAVGVLLAYVEDVNVTYSRVSTSTYGIHVSSSDRVLLRRNVLFENEYGLTLEGVKNASIFQNDVDLQGENGIRIAFSSNVSVTENVARTARIAMLIRGSSNVTVTENQWISNTYGVVLDDARSVKAYHNTFTRNIWQAQDDGGGENAWDGGYPTGGNTWSDYPGRDKCRGPNQDDCSVGDQIGDTPYEIDSDSVDRYPRALPNRPPVAGFSVQGHSFTATALLTMDASLSSDHEDSPPELQVRWDWEGDGEWDTLWSTEKVQTHRYDSPGGFDVQLGVRDSGGLEDYTSRQISISANKPPTATFFLTPAQGDTSTTFRATAGVGLDVEDPLGLLYRWDWEDDRRWETPWQGQDADTHQYRVAGTYTIRLEVQDRGGLMATTTRSVVVESAGDSDPFVPTLSLAEHPEKPFTIGIPPSWDVTWDYEIPDVGTADLAAFGPIEAGFQTNFIVASEMLFVTESDAFLLEGADELLAELARTERFDVLSGPEIATTVNTRAALLVIQYKDEPLMQVIGLVVSEGHDRAWVLVGSAGVSATPSNEPLFVAMIESFELTESQPISFPISTPLLILLPVAAVGGIGLAILLWRRRSRVGPAYAPSSPNLLSSAEGVSRPSLCTSCGAPLRPSNRFCGRCGTQVK